MTCGPSWSPAKKPCASVELRNRSRNERQKAVLLNEAARLQWQIIAGKQFRMRLAELHESSVRLCEDSARLIGKAKELRNR